MAGERQATGRRRSRRAVLAGLAALAGCNTDGSSSTTPETEATATRTPTTTRTPTPTPEPEPLPLGYVFPESGTFGRFGQAYARGVELAVEDVDAAGGPLGRPVELHGKDSKGNGSLARDRYEELLEADVRGAVLFPLGSSIGGIDRRVRRNRLVEVFNVSLPVHDVGYVDGTKYVAQTAHDERADGTALAAALGDGRFAGADRASFLYPDYVDSAARLAARAFEGTTVASVAYDPHRDDGDYTAVLEEAFAGDPDAVGCVPHPDATGTILRQWADGDYGGDWAFTSQADIATYRYRLEDDAPAMYRVAPAPERGRGWQRFRERHPDPSLKGAASAYDALFLQALAAHRAGEATSEAIAENLRAVSRPPGEPVTVGEFGKAKAILDDGGAVDYQGAAHAVDLSPALTPFVRYEVRTASARHEPLTEGHLPPEDLRPPGE